MRRQAIIDNIQQISWWRNAAIVVALIAVAVTPSLAQAPENNALSTIVEQYRTRSQGWEPVIQRYALSLFWLLATIQFVWTGIRVVIEGADIKGIAAALVQRTLVVGLFYLFLLNGTSWAGTIVDSMAQLANEANAANGVSTTIKPATILDIGLSLAGKIVGGMSMLSPVDSLSLFVAGTVIVVCFALIAAFMLAALCELYIVMNAGLIVLSFGATDWTSSYALNYFRHIFATALKLFVMQLVVGLGQGFVQDWSAGIEANTNQVFSMIGISIVFLALVKEVPSTAASLIDRPISGSDRGIIPAANTVGATTAAAAVGVSTRGYQSAGMVGSATSLAQAQTGSAGGVGGALLTAGRAATNIAGAAMQDLNARAMDHKNPLWKATTMPSRMGAQMSSKRDAIREGREEKASLSAASPSSSSSSSSGKYQRDTTTKQTGNS
jgi:type IV secretion system protein TrbL